VKRWESVTQLSEQPNSAECFTGQCSCGARYKTGNVCLINLGQCHDSSFTWHAHQQSVAEPKLLSNVFVTDISREERCVYLRLPEIPSLPSSEAVLTLLSKELCTQFVGDTCGSDAFDFEGFPSSGIRDVLQCNRWRHHVCA